MLKEFQTFGRDLFLAGLNSSHSGNLSVRCGDRVFITRRGAMLGHLMERDIIETGLHKNDGNIVLASTEIRVHRAIYKETAALAIVHAHPVHAIALSLLEEEIIPLDSEGAYLLHKIPVLSAEHTIGSQELEEKLPGLLKEYKIVMVRGHGSFATGQLLEEAYQWTSSLENICRIIHITRTLKGALKDKRPDEYKEW
ncbi:aldolase [Pelotomaculum terephthalicicum JT]|uniref:aldolase n=1 Tax=Pelotomaculum TaxID=191373 RepID=UPI0009C47823|nr:MULTISPECIES: aldolase [Pelotomaculum]MCG9967121.1 aldolase [Pelotomaculum terephthalicicum JT]OPX87781.1 MAG: L-fuculose phosphate aldolase [Pelotomaculum sp. PtaB.Bin117]OPY60467.1 MAG: L-fuculose phosphate aldolase [Pelotomaculum sp. PtaU1.Bin065]